ncbi:MAG: hypothetical protein KGY74_05270 [Candidatus Cloacimonetes bacterium]|nr:hypothetical protein [Candidatus Cloacimonadota bacterium]
MKIAKILEAVFTKKKSKGERQTSEQKFKNMATEITEKEKKAWIKAGMPPIKKFLQKVRNKNA